MIPFLDITLLIIITKKKMSDKPPVPTKIIAGALRDLSETIQSDDGVANGACSQAAERLDELEALASELVFENVKLKNQLEGDN